MNTPRPRIDYRRRLVMIYSPSLQAWALDHLTKDGHLHAGRVTAWSFEEDPAAAARAMGYSYAGFTSVHGMAGRRFDTHAEQVMATWAAGLQQTTSAPMMGAANLAP